MGSVCPHNLWVRVQVIRELTCAMPYYDYRDPQEPEVDRLEDNDRNWAMELWAHCAHITRYEKAAHDAWQ